jgi:serine/threonine-protein kinase RsbW
MGGAKASRMKKEKTTPATRSVLTASEGPAPDLGKPAFAREIPSDPALVTPLVVRVLEHLKEESLVDARGENRIALCLEEALQNAVVHGNKLRFQNRVQLRIHVGDDAWHCVVTDEGDGFDPRTLKDPLGPDAIWGEHGRGIYLISHYMDDVEYFDGGSTIVMTKKR